MHLLRLQPLPPPLPRPAPFCPRPFLRPALVCFPLLRFAPFRLRPSSTLARLLSPHRQHVGPERDAGEVDEVSQSLRNGACQAAHKQGQASTTRVTNRREMQLPDHMLTCRGGRRNALQVHLNTDAQDGGSASNSLQSKCPIYLEQLGCQTLPCSNTPTCWCLLTGWMRR